MKDKHNFFQELKTMPQLDDIDDYLDEEEDSEEKDE